MVNETSSKNYIYFDGEPEREQAIIEIGRVRQAVKAVVEVVPEEQWYEPRYHGWSLGAMLGHLNSADNAAMLLIRLALLGIAPRISTKMNDGINGFTSRLYRRRLISASLKSVDANNERIADFIRHVPIDKLSNRVYNVSEQTYTTVERVIQDYFIFHWEHHLNTLVQVEGIQPPEQRSDNR